MNYIDIHTHTWQEDPETTRVLNLFPGEQEKLALPSFFSVGLHPWHVQDDTWEEMVEQVGSMAGNRNVLAIGEAGLDKIRGTRYDAQKHAFYAQMDLAGKLKKPLIIHCVRAYDEMLALRKRSDQSVPWIFHWFNADGQTAAELIRKNCYLSFGHMLFREESKAFTVFKSVPLEQVYFETDDAGYTIAEVYARAALIRNLDPDALKTQIMDNFGRCFQL